MGISFVLTIKTDNEGIPFAKWIKYLFYDRTYVQAGKKKKL